MGLFDYIVDDENVMYHAMVSLACLHSHFHTIHTDALYKLSL